MAFVTSFINQLIKILISLSYFVYYLLIISVCVLYICRDAAGKIIKPAPFQSRINSGTMARVEPNRKWFGMR